MDNYADNVKIIVGKNFFNEVLNNTFDILLELYSPYSQQCKEVIIN